MEEGRTTENRNDFEGEIGTALEPNKSQLTSAEFVKVEKNLASLGFFTPSSKRTRNEKSKTITATVVVDGKRIEAKATIAPTALFGLPITADQDKWLALNKILVDVQTREGQVTNPVSFSSAELLALLKIYKDSGKNYRDVSDWLDVMVGTTIISEGAVYFAGKKTFGKDVYHVFDRAVSFGKQLPDGSIADKNYVWLSQWQLQNINDHHQLPIDLDAYRQLKNYISKALVPLLQVWLFATRDDGVFEKRYDELCQILNIRQWNYPSKIKEKFGASLDELKQFGYLSNWRLEETSDKHSYKILFFHGEKFHRDRNARQNRKRIANSSPEARSENYQYPRPLDREDRRQSSAVRPGTAPATQQHFDPILVSEITRRGIHEKKAHELLANLKPGQEQDLIAQLEHAEQIVQRSQIPITNPAGFIIRLIERNTPVPDGFETSAQRKAREERERKERERRVAKEAQQELEWAYDDYRDAEIDRYITANTAAFENLKDAKWEEERERYSFATESMARIAARIEIQKQLTFLTFEEFLERKRQGTDLFLKPVPPSPMPELSLAIEPETKNTTAAIEYADAPVEAAPTNQPESGIEPFAAGTEAVAPTVEPEVHAMPEPLTIELVSEPPPNELGLQVAEQETA